ncbi:alpha-galactosidase D [Sphaerisporangium fuscum]|uniref:alpha-galactosidase D n=1 Tax=Sphaerisporangium fuscum TaxID=2835868 RepID=UPI001BDC8529|nr:alpha-galactosidase [Sphaerisporangium fuscum]
MSRGPRRRLLTLLTALSAGVASAMGGVAAAPGASASDNGLSIRPAMGWSSWSWIRRTPTEAKIKAQADALVSSGLAAHGFVYVNLDDFYQKCDSNGFVVDSYGRWAVDPAKFPSGIKALADYVHGKGLKFGFYVTPGIARNAVTANTPILGTSYHAKDIADTSRTEKNYNCKNMYYIDYGKPGAQEFVDSWADQFASWGIDYLKIDGVGSADVADVEAWDKALRRTGRPINFALSNNLPIADAATWKRLANSWRTQGDVECYCGPGPNGSGHPLTDWSHVSGRFTSAANWQPYAGPGGWNDLDSLEVGNGDRAGLTADQRRSMFTLWAMAASPLLLGTDLTDLDPVDVAMLTNDRLIAVDQDGVAASRIVNSGSGQVWRKREAGGDYIVALFNTGTSGGSTVSVTWSQVGFSGGAKVVDLWSGASEGTISGSYSATLRPGETRLIRVTPTSAPPASSYEAESGALSGAAAVAACSGCSGGSKVRFIGDSGANHDTITVNAYGAGSRSLTISGLVNGTRSFSVSVNGGAAQTATLTGTDWSTPVTTSLTVTLNAGSNTIRFFNDTAYAPDLDKITIG